MIKLLKKEIKLASSPLSFFFLLSAFLTFIPGYPILVASFFTTLGIFYSYQTARENSDITYSLLLPVAKKDVVRGKYAFTIFIELCSLFLIFVITLIRMLLLSGTEVYLSNALMPANFTALGFSLFIFGLFNFIFANGFWKTAYYFGKPFIIYCIFAFITVTAAESLHYIPIFERFFGLSFCGAGYQFIPFLLGLIGFVLLTAIAVNRSEKSFEKTDI